MTHEQRRTTGLLAATIVYAAITVSLALDRGAPVSPAPAAQPARSAPSRAELSRLSGESRVLSVKLGQWAGFMKGRAARASALRLSRVLMNRHRSYQARMNAPL